MSQPRWKLIANLGDASPIDYGGYFVYVDETGVYPPEAEVLESPDSDNAPEGWTVYRFPLERCTFVGGVLSDNSHHPDYPAWFADDISKTAGSTDYPIDELRADLCSADPIRLASAYRAIGEYHGFDNLDSCPLTFSDRASVEKMATRSQQLLTPFQDFRDTTHHAHKGDSTNGQSHTQQDDRDNVGDPDV